jgi:hypothetical protein
LLVLLSDLDYASNTKLEEPMEEQDKEYQFVKCECGKTLRLTISEKNYGKKVVTFCQNCKREHLVTISPPEVPNEIVNTDFEEIKPYADMLAEKIGQVLQDAGDREDIASLRALFLEKGFSVGLIACLGIIKNGTVQKEEMPKTESDADFLKKMKIRFDN